MQRTPEAAADGLLRFAWADDGDLRIPVDAVQIATQLGIQVFDADLAQDISGTIVKRAGEDAVIMLARRDSDQRKRFTTAHELGHFDDHASRGDEDYSYEERRTALGGPGQPPDERYANQFAAALLMPERHLRKFAAIGRSVVELAQMFGVSTDAMYFRLKNLGLI